ncbi:MAG: hypothetical protein NTX50_04740 [Candidatus Sumerlaeota bacterium]|nr:hypothetical protein [Candidatus Sumerlaeota bacterium]
MKTHQTLPAIKAVKNRRAFSHAIAITIALLALVCPTIAIGQTGSLNVTIEPEQAVQAGAKWSVDGGDYNGWWLDSGMTAPGLPTYRATVTFSDIPGWTTPPPIKMWVFAGIDRATSTTYYPLATYPLGEIPPFQVAQGQTLKFQVYSRDLGASATLTAVADPTTPTGTFTADLGTSLGLFAYAPAAADKTPFDVVFTASAPGTDTITQRVTFTPLPALPDEYQVFGLNPGLTVPGETGGDAPQVITETATYSGWFNLMNHPTVRNITITGEDVVFDSAESGGLFERFNYQSGTGANKDIASLTVNAVRVIIRGAMRMPKTNVIINALELRFEDNNGFATICTTPLYETLAAKPCYTGTWNYKTGEYSGNPTEQAHAGKDGEKSGDLTFNIASCYPVASHYANRLSLGGAPGQDGGAGANGRNGWQYPELPMWTGSLNYSLPPGEYATFIQTTDWWPPIPWPNISTSGDASLWPGPGEDAFPAGKPGAGGAGGNCNSTIRMFPYSYCSDGGEYGTLSIWYYSGGTIATRKCHHIWLTAFYSSVTGVNTDETKDFEPGTAWNSTSEAWRNDAMYRTRAANGNFSLQGDSLAFVNSSWMKLMVKKAKDEYLFGDVDKAEERLSKYVDLIDVIESRLPADAVYTTEQMDLFSLRDEMRGLLHQIASKLDYFGNPAGWVPLLSFEVNMLAFSNEIEHALNTMYLAYWVRNTGFTLESRLGALRKLRSDLGDQSVALKAEYEDVMAKIPQMRTQADRISSDTRGAVWEMKALTDELRAQAQHNTAGTWALQIIWSSTQYALRLSAIVYECVPIGQPILGSIGGVMDIVGKFDVNNLQESITGSLVSGADVTAKLANDLYQEKLASVTEEVKGVDPQDTSISTRTKSMANLAKATGALSQGISKASTVLGSYTMPKQDIDGELQRLMAESPEYTTLTKRMMALAEEKMILFEQMTQADILLVILPNLIMRNMLVMDEVQRQIDRNESVFSPKAIEAINEIERRSRERLLKYHYYMSKAYEYRILKPYPGQLNLAPVIDQIIAMAAVATTASLTQAQFDSLKEPYVEQISALAEDIFTQYNSNPPDLSAPIGFNLTPGEIADLNAGKPVTINLMDRGLFPPTEENVRIVDFVVDTLDAHLEVTSSPLPNWAIANLYMSHSGISRIMNKGEVYCFRHYNPLTENPIVWGARYDHLDGVNPITPIRPSAASDSLLRSLLSGAASQDMLLYSRPGAWADIVLTKEVNTEHGEDIIFDSVRVKVTYDFTRRATNQAALHVGLWQQGLLPHFIINANDLNSRRDGRGDIYRNFAKNAIATVTAPPTYGAWQFQKWTDAYGNNLSDPVVTDAPQATNGLGASTPHTNPAITVDLSNHRSLKAKYVRLADPSNPAPPDSQTGVERFPAFSWANVPDGLLYDIRIWESSDAKPTTFTATGLAMNQYLPSTPLDANTTYSWQVVVRADLVSVEGPVWSFATSGNINPTPTMRPTPSPTPTPKPTPSPTPTPPPTGTTFTLALAAQAHGSAAKSPDRSAYSSGTIVTVMATPEIGFAFDGWLGDAPTSQVLDNPTTITMDRDKALTATFTRGIGTVSVQVTPPGASWLYVDGEGTTYTGTGAIVTTGVAAGDIAFTWFPLTDYYTPVPTTTVKQLMHNGKVYFTGFYLSTAITPSPTPSPSPSPSPSPTPSPSPSPSPSPTPQYRLIVTIDGMGSGTVTREPILPVYPQGTSVTLTAYPTTAGVFPSIFTLWSGPVITTSNPVVLAVNYDTTMTAMFILMPTSTGIINHLSGAARLTGNDLLAADINGDGVIDIADIVAIIQRIRLP